MDNLSLKNIEGIAGGITGGIDPLKQKPARKPLVPKAEAAAPSSEIDPQVKALTMAIGRAETSNDPNAYSNKGASGEYGRYQFTQDTWKQYAKDVLGDANADITSIENQNKVAYGKVKQMKEAGMTPAQIASTWNSGNPNAYLENKRGINRYGVAYDVPAYVQKVSSNYEQLKSQVAQTTGSSTNAPTAPQKAPEEGLGQQLGGRGGDAVSAINSIVGGKKTGSSRASGLLQLGGAIAGGIGDLTNAALELIPGVKQVENLIGQGVGALAKTETGQSVVKAIEEFSNKHPELAKDIGAGFNIITAIPILKGLGVAANVGLDAASMALKGTLEKSLSTGLAEAATTKAAKKAFSPDVVKTIIDERLPLDIKDGRFSTHAAEARLDAMINHIDETKLMPELEKASTNKISERIPLEQYRKEAIADAEDNLLSSTGVENMYDLIKKKYGDYPTLKQMNEAKRKVSKRISESAFGSPEANSAKIVRSSLQKSVEEGAAKLGLEDVGKINQEMARLIKAQKFLSTISDKAVKQGIVGTAAEGAGMLAGGALAGGGPVGFAGTLLGGRLGGYVENKVAGIPLKLLKRTGKGAVKQTKKTIKKKGAGLIAGALAQKSAD